MAPARFADWLTGCSFVAIVGELIYLRYKRTEFRFCVALKGFVLLISFLTLALVLKDATGYSVFPGIEQFQIALLAVFSLSLAIWLGDAIRRIQHMPRLSELEGMVRERTNALQSVIDCSPIAIVQADANRIISIWSPAAEKLFGWKASEVLGKPLPTIPESKLEEFEKNLIETLENKQKPGLMTQRKHKDGHLIDVCIWNVPLRSGRARENFAMGMFADMTHEKEMTENLNRAKIVAEQANEAKSRFLAYMSHEIRTPLNAIVGFADLLLNEELDEEQRRTFLQTVARNGKSLSCLINDILDMSKIEAGEMNIDPGPVSVREIMKDVQQTLELKTSEKGIKLEVSISDRVPGEILADGLRLRQILMNLLGNAVKFTEKGGVFIRADHAGERLKIFVRDTGPGMTPAQQRGLFCSYSQADHSITAKYGGTGLGLYLSRELARLMGGHLMLKDSVVGRGSVFELQITAPVARTERTSDFRTDSPPTRLHT